MEETQFQEDNVKVYILDSKKNIDSYINKNEFKKAFGLLILVLERLDDGQQKRELISYYSENLIKFGILGDTFHSR